MTKMHLERDTDLSSKLSAPLHAHSLARLQNNNDFGADGAGLLTGALGKMTAMETLDLVRQRGARIRGECTSGGSDDAVRVSFSSSRNLFACFCACAEIHWFLVYV